MNPMVVTTPAALPAAAASDRSWFLTTDPRRIGLLYLAAITFFAAVAFAAQGMTRLELATPDGDVISAFLFGRMSSLHALLITFFFALPAIPSVFGLTIAPGLVGARGLAFPRLALVSWYLFVTGGLLILGAALTGNVESGWAYAVTASSSAVSASSATMMGIFLACVALLLTGLNLLVTLAKLRSPDCGWRNQSPFAWSLCASGLIMVLALPLFAMTVLLGLLEHVFALGLFDPANGGDPTILPQLASTFSAPATWLVLLPAMGVASTILDAAARRRDQDRRLTAGCFVALAALSLLTWTNGIPTGGVPGRFSLIFAVFGFVALAPFAMVVGQWVRTLYRGSVALSTSLIYAMGFIFVATAGVFLGLLLSPVGLGSYLRGTEFGVAQFQYTVVGGGLLAVLAALHHWWPEMTGRSTSETVSRATAVAVIGGLQLTFVPQFILGQLGLPAGHYAYPPEFQLYHVLCSAGGTILIGGLLCTFAYFMWSLREPPSGSAAAG
jgi:cytochrome c oxidase subunit 1